MSFGTGAAQGRVRAIRGAPGLARNRTGVVSSGMDPAPRPWAFLARLQVDPSRLPGELSLGLHRAVGELRSAAKADPLRAGEGALLLCERLPAAVAVIDDPVGTVAGAIARSLDAVAPLIAAAPTSPAQRDAWLARLWTAIADDELGHLRRLAEHWGDLCVTRERAAAWAGRLLPAAREGVGTPAAVACLASQVAAADHDAALALLAARAIAVWPERQFGVRALAARGELDQALRYAADSNPLGHRHAQDIARVCEAVLLAGGRRDDAYRRFAVAAHTRQNCRQTFEALLRAYPERAPGQLLADLIAGSPGQEGRWFATACALRFYTLAAEIAGRSPCDPRTLVRCGAQRLAGDPAFAGEVALAAIRWLCGGHGVEISGDDVYAALDLARAAAVRTGAEDRLRAALAAVCDQPHPAAQWVHGLLARELEGPWSTPPSC